MNKPRVFGWSVGSIIAVVVAAGSLLIYWETRSRSDQSQDDRILALERNDTDMFLWRNAIDTRIRNTESLETWIVIVMSMIAERQGIKNLPPLPLMDQVPKTGSMWTAPGPTSTDSIRDFVLQLEMERQQTDKAHKEMGP